jgi:rhodanese-related sulfurtransferase
MMNISITELKQRLDSGEKLVLIDVREPWEHEERNIGGKNVPLHSIEQRMRELEQYRTSEIIVYCNSGNRSGTAMHVLERFGFTSVRALENGMQGW